MRLMIFGDLLGGWHDLCPENRRLAHTSPAEGLRREPSYMCLELDLPSAQAERDPLGKAKYTGSSVRWRIDCSHRFRLL